MDSSLGSLDEPHLSYNAYHTAQRRLFDAEKRHAFSLFGLLHPVFQWQSVVYKLYIVQYMFPVSYASLLRKKGDHWSIGTGAHRTHVRSLNLNALNWHTLVGRTG